jgi:hypothetical protein
MLFKLFLPFDYDFVSNSYPWHACCTFRPSHSSRSVTVNDSIRCGKKCRVLAVHLSVCLSRWNNSAPTWRIFMKFYIWGFFENPQRKLKFDWNLTKNNAYFPWRRIYVYDNISLKMISVSDKSCRESENTHLCSPLPPPPMCAVCEIMWKPLVAPDRPQMIPV